MCTDLYTCVFITLLGIDNYIRWHFNECDKTNTLPRYQLLLGSARKKNMKKQKQK